MKKSIKIIMVVLFALFLVYIITYQIPERIISYTKRCKLEYGAPICLCTSEPVDEFVYDNGAWIPKSGEEVEIFECKEGETGTRFLSVFNSGNENITELEIYLDSEIYSAQNVIESGRPYPMKLGNCKHGNITDEYSNLKVKWCCGKDCFEDILRPEGVPEGFNFD